MRRVANIGLGWLLAASAACGGAEPNVVEPSPSAAQGSASASEPSPEPEPEAADAEAGAEADAGVGEGSEGEVALDGPRVELDASFHRTRVGPGRGFWVLGTVTNPRERAVADLRPVVRLRDEDGTMLLEVEGEARAAGAGQTVALVVLVEAPVVHEQLELSATGVETEAFEPAPTLKLEHDAPQRAKLGGWFVLGQLLNEGAAAEGAELRIEVRAYDDSDRLLGVDWFAARAPKPGEAAPFDLGGLRYEEPPKRFELELIAPA